MTETRSSSERRFKATVDGTLFIEKNRAPHFNKLYYSCKIQDSGTAGICWILGAIQNPFLVQFLFGELPPSLTVPSRVGILKVPCPSQSHQVATWCPPGPSDSSKQTGVRTEQWVGSTGFSSDSDTLGQSFKLLVCWNCPASSPFPKCWSFFCKLLAISPTNSFKLAKGNNLCCLQPKNQPVWWEEPGLTLAHRRRELTEPMLSIIHHMRCGAPRLYIWLLWNST